MLWQDASGSVWILGGEGEDSAGSSGYLNDLWMYDPATKMWTWESGADTANPPGVYGSLGVQAPANQPGGRQYLSAAQDGSGNVWMFGGEGEDSAGAFGNLNDLWKFIP